MIPLILQNKDFRFVKLKKNEKVPFEANWQQKGYAFDDASLLAWIEAGGNYGVIGGFGRLRMLDIDEPALVAGIAEVFKTFSVRTGKGGMHFYFLSDYDKNHVLGGGKGELRCNLQFVVGPGSLHPNGTRYSIANDAPLLNITGGKLSELLKPFFDFKNTKIDYGKVLKGEIETGSRNDGYFRAACVMRFQGIPRETTTHILQTSNEKNAAPLNRAELQQCINSAYSYEDKQRNELYIEADVELLKVQQKVLFLLAAQKRTEVTEEIVIYLKNKFKFYSIRTEHNPEIWVYEEGIYIQNGISYIKEICRKILLEAHTSHLSNSVIAKIEADTFVLADDFFNQDIKQYIPVKNGLLDIYEKKLLPFTPDKVFFSKLPVIYDPSKSCDNIVKHFKTVLRNSDDILTFQELFGYLLLKENTFEIAVMMNGYGRNGKSKTLGLIKSFLGTENCSSISLEQLETDQYAMGNLFGKMVNLAGDLSRTALKNTGNFKNCIGRDTITANRKNLTHLNFINYAKMFFACNELPISYDNTDGFWSKWLFFDFPYKFVSKEEYEQIKDKDMYRIKDEEILTKLTTPEELSGLLNWALEGLERLLKNKTFSTNKTSTEIRNIWIRKSDSLKAFCIDNIEEDYNSYVTKKEFRYMYGIFCRENKLRAASDKYIKTMLAEEYGVSEGRCSVENSQEHVWYGIKCKQVSQGSQGCHHFHNHLEISNSLVTSKTLTTLTTLTNSEDFVVDNDILIHQKCKLCGETPCVTYNNVGHPICKQCLEYFRNTRIPGKKEALTCSNTKND